MKVSVSMPLDNDGFLRRECPTCQRQFKWHSGPASESAEGQPSPSLYYCPLCGQASALDRWNTSDQNEYAQGVAMAAAMRELDEQLGAAFKGMSSKNVKVTKTGHLDQPDVPDALTEPDDMVIVVSPCHDWEPVKVPEDATSPLYCLVCGSAFAL